MSLLVQHSHLSYGFIRLTNMQMSCRFRDVGLCFAWAYSFGLVDFGLHHFTVRQLLKLPSLRKLTMFKKSCNSVRSPEDGAAIHTRVFTKRCYLEL